MKRMHHTLGSVWVSWEKGSDQKRAELHGPDYRTNYLRFEDYGTAEAVATWNSGKGPVSVDVDSFDLRALAGEFLAMADTLDRREGVVPAPIPKMDPMAAEFFACFDPKGK